MQRESLSPTLLAACVLSASLGTIHTFSLFITPLEGSLGATRAQVSAVYSVALVGATVGVAMSHRVFRAIRAEHIALGVGMTSAALLAVSAAAGSVWLLIASYGIGFGIVNGLGYAFALQVGARAMPSRSGLALGLVTASYALGAAIASRPIEAVIDRSGTSSALLIFAGSVAAAAILAMLMIRRAALQVGHGSSGSSVTARGIILRLWLAYGMTVTAGLMVLGHASAIVEQTSGTEKHRAITVMLVTIGNALGGAAIALFADRIAVRPALTALPLLSAVTLGAMPLAEHTAVVLTGLIAASTIYGAVIALYPFAVLQRFGSADYPRAYGQIFTAWGIGGLIGPFAAGALFDWSGNYNAAFLSAGAAAVLGAVVAASTPTTTRSS